MLDFGWSEFFLIVVLAIVLMGPKDIPDIIYQFGRLVRRLQYMKFALSRQFDAFMEENDLQELRRGGGLGDMRGDLRSALTPKQAESASDLSDEADEDETYHGMPVESAVPSFHESELPLEGGWAPSPKKAGAKKS